MRGPQGLNVAAAAHSPYTLSHTANALLFLSFSSGPTSTGKQGGVFPGRQTATARKVNIYTKK